MGDILVVDKGKRRNAVRRTTRLIATAESAVQVCGHGFVRWLSPSAGATHATTSGRVPAQMMEPALSSGGIALCAPSVARLKK